MRFISPKWFFATAMSLLICRVLMAAFPLIDESLRTDPHIVVAVECGLVLLLLAGFALQLLGDELVVQAERSRIARDLHDGLGFHLSTALLLAGDTRKTHSDAWLAVELAIVELHSVIHCVNAESVPIAQSMGSLRHRLQKVVQRQGLEVMWHVREDIPDDVLVGVAAYNFVKIVQEAVSNVLQHAGASRLLVELGCPWPQQALVLRIVDNGRGISAQPNGRGRGLDGMARRAHLLGGTFKIEPIPEGGTSVRLTVPLPCTLTE